MRQKKWEKKLLNKIKKTQEKTYNKHIEKSNLECLSCGSDHVIRLQWSDVYPEGSHWYDDHICLDCGRNVNQSTSVCLETLEKYRKKYGHLVFEK